jgi:hypothetical protein
VCRTQVDTVVLKPPDRRLIPNRVRNDWVAVDRCIAEAVALLWFFGYPTVGSCCGHGKWAGEIVVGAAYMPERESPSGD